MEHLYQKLKEFGSVKTNEPLSKHTTFKIGGPASFLVTVSETDQLVALLQYLDAEGVAYFMLGGGSNMLVRDEGFEGVVIRMINDKPAWQQDRFQILNSVVEVGAGMNTAQLARETVKAGLTGFEWGVGIPGTIGGAVRGNAGAMGKEMKDDVLKVEAYVDGQVQEYLNRECAFGYRHSGFKEHGGVILRVWLQLQPSENKDGMKIALAALQYRNETQPKGFASTGCVFKNSDLEKNRALLLRHFDEQDEKVQQFLRVGKISAGWLVEKAGMKGKRVGSAEVSPVHGNFIVSLGKASSKDVLTLIELVKQKVYDTYGIALEEEIQII